VGEAPCEIAPGEARANLGDVHRRAHPAGRTFTVHEACIEVFARVGEAARRLQ
jgi:hypothetical protein